MPFDTAFQRYAFQDDAFQIVISTSGVSRLKRLEEYYCREIFTTKAEKKTVKKLVKQLDKAKKDKDVDESTKNKIISALNPFISPTTKEQFDRAAEGRYFVDEIPSVQLISFSKLLKNELSMQRLTLALDKLKVLEQLRREEEEEEEEYMLVLLLSSTI